MEEKWKLITCLSKQEFSVRQYEASNLGRIRAKTTKYIMTPKLNNTGYLMFRYSWYDTEGVRHQHLEAWHRVIAKTWLPNPDNLPQIDHINRDKFDNSVANLRWVNNSENQQNREKRQYKKNFNRQNPVYKIDKDFNVLAVYENAMICAEQEGTTVLQINKYCNGDKLPKKNGTTYTQDVYLNNQNMKLVEDDTGFHIIKIDN